jgi:hypothetical protein
MRGFLSAAFLLLVVSWGVPKSLAAPPGATISASDLEAQKLALDRDRFEFEKTKYQRDHDLEVWKAWGLFLPVCGAGLAYYLQAKQKRKDEKLAFELKAAEIIMTSRDSAQGWNKGKFLLRLFPERLSNINEVYDRVQRSEDAKDGKEKQPYFGPSDENRHKLLELLAQYPESRRDIIAAWGHLFPWDSDPNWPTSDKSKYRWYDKIKADQSVNVNRAPVEPAERDSSSDSAVCVISELFRRFSSKTRT